MTITVPELSQTVSVRLQSSNEHDTGHNEAVRSKAVKNEGNGMYIFNLFLKKFKTNSNNRKK
jgi:hypothetical protein